MTTNRRSLLLLVVYLIAHVILLWLKPIYFMKITEVWLQLLLLLPAALIDLKRTTFSFNASPLYVPARVQIALLLAFLVGGIAANHYVTAGRLTGGDESAYRFQARIFASGHVTVVAPPASVHFTHHIIHGGRWFTKFPPGWPAVLALASAIRLGSQINILFGLIILWTTYAVGKVIYSDREAGLAVFLMVVSPFFFCSCLGHWSHPLCGCLLAGSVYFYLLAENGFGLGRLGAMLACITAAILVRPLTGFLFGLVLGGTFLWNVRHVRSQLWKTLVLCTIFALVAIVGTGAYNHATTGNSIRFPYALYADTKIPLEVVPDRSVVTRNISRILSTWFFMYPLIIPLAGFAVYREQQKRKEALILAALFVLLVLGYCVNRYSSDILAGERFYFEAFFAISLLGARGVVLLEQFCEASGWPRRWLGPVAASSLLTLVFILPGILAEARPYVEVRAAAEHLMLNNAVVFLKSSDPEFHATYFNLNRANWQAAPIFFAPDTGPAERQLLARALGRRSWVVITYDPTTQKPQISHVTIVR